MTPALKTRGFRNALGGGLAGKLSSPLFLLFASSSFLLPSFFFVSFCFLLDGFSWTIVLVLLPLRGTDLKRTR